MPSKKKRNIYLYIIMIIIAFPLIMPIFFYSVDNITSKTSVYDISSTESIIISENINELTNYNNYDEPVKSIYIPDTISKIPSNFFDRFTDLENIYYGGTWEEWGELLGSNQPNGVTIFFDISENSLNVI